MEEILYDTLYKDADRKDYYIFAKHAVDYTTQHLTGAMELCVAYVSAEGQFVFERVTSSVIANKRLLKIPFMNAPRWVRFIACSAGIFEAYSDERMATETEYVTFMNNCYVLRNGWSNYAREFFCAMSRAFYGALTAKANLESDWCYPVEQIYDTLGTKDPSDMSSLYTLTLVRLAGNNTLSVQHSTRLIARYTKFVKFFLTVLYGNLQSLNVLTLMNDVKITNELAIGFGVRNPLQDILCSEQVHSVT